MTRRVLPNRRPGIAMDFEHGGIRCRGMASFDADGQWTEVFLDCGKPGSALRAVAHDCAVAASLAMQHGTPVATLSRALTRADDGSAAGPLGTFLDLLDMSAGRPE